MRKRILFGVLLVGGLFSQSCGGNSEGGGASCGKVQPCGGNPVGSWKIVASCLDTSALSDALVAGLSSSGCTGVTVQSSHAKQTGSATFNADMTYSSSLTTSFDATLLVPSSCITQGGFTLTCDQLNQALKQAMNDEIGDVTCTKASGGCSCKMVAPPNTVDENGTYTVSGTRIAKTSDAVTDSGGEFCVQDDELHMISLDEGNVDAQGQPKILADVVAKKQ
jgi:hypothetical protein